jgi:RimJ/RimL family protein N-acetyltransferase
MAKRPTKRSVSYRKAGWQDLFFLYRLRNQPETYRFFRNNRPVKFIEHFLWLSRVFPPNSDKTLYVVLSNGVKVGQIRFDRLKQDSSEVSISITKNQMGKGIMSYVFPQATKAYLHAYPDVKNIYAFIQPTNKASIHFFEKLKFSKRGQRKGQRITELVYVKKKGYF